MIISEQRISEFQNFYKKYSGEEISREEALESGMNLVHLMQIIYKPIRKSDSEYQKRSELKN